VCCLFLNKQPNETKQAVYLSVAETGTKSVSVHCSMQFEFGFYSSLLLIFFVHGLVYAVLLYRKSIRNETKADRWLSVFLLLCVLYIAPWMLGFAGWYDNQPYRDLLFYLPFQQLFFIGPVIFFYVQSLLNPSFRFDKKEWLHLLPGMLYLLFCAVMVVTDKLVLQEYFFLASGADPDFDTWYQVAGFASMLFYFLISLRYYTLYRKMIVQVISYSELVSFKWVRNFLYAFLSMLLLRLLFFIASEIPAFAAMAYAGSWWLYFLFALIFYYIAITGYSNSVETHVPFKLKLLEYRKALLLPSTSLTEEAGTEDAEAIVEIDTIQPDVNRDDAALLQEWKPKIEQWLKAEKAYEDPELSLTQVAKYFSTNPSLISRVINLGFRQNFNDCINYYRVEAVKEKLRNGEQQRQTLLSIALDCGFNSKATFNRSFKKVTGMSPREWMEKKG
jgi:AraC-like DNA-binding protein